ncbi:fumarate reductase iron-sulfur subunit [Halodesulfovibrio sp. MK-HDV]|jgi:succinate dehydrogenase iron-sulfur subunit|uniref:fumarate reductase iron-sulfur subunit n=1 Tax=Halodesulfovibrio sp. MK-HDV TaxID=2599925 RepID=UPI00136974AC|nr:fumarate reductase iron-sulfur subunit [Halodesulfovibrio sp. MK-HDV]KAF1076019.1 Fumarate reductase iron-sulfur subunit [Halodesulfovibrio sp. MK-HDV]
MSRRLHIEVFRYNPLDPNSEPQMQSFYIDEYDSMTLFIALNIIRDQHDATLQFDFCCRAGICGSCGMVINGRPGLACHTQTKDLPTHIVLHPLPVFKLIGDLSVDTGVWFRDAGTRIEAWVHNDHEALDPTQEEARMENSLANEIFELDRCVECGCCIAACGTARMRPDFLGAAAIARVARFYLDPRDERNVENYYEVIGNDQGVFGCMGLLACEDVCPKHIPLQDQLGIMRRMLALHSVKGIVPKSLINKLSHKGCCHENHQS